MLFWTITSILLLGSGFGLFRLARLKRTSSELEKKSDDLRTHLKMLEGKNSGLNKYLAAINKELVETKKGPGQRDREA
jgi:hypothetical protein